VTIGSASERLDISFSLVTEAEPPLGVVGDELEMLAAFVLSSEGAAGYWEITVALVDDARLQSLHWDFMGIDTPTDIMTFPTDESAGEPQGGELAISVDHAKTQAVAWGLSPTEEIVFLVVHGLLHLCGWRDDTEEQRQSMLDRQLDLFERWRQQASRGGRTC
jgi:probable rRNA maturation factor